MFDINDIMSVSDILAINNALRKIDINDILIMDSPPLRKKYINSINEIENIFHNIDAKICNIYVRKPINIQVVSQREIMQCTGDDFPVTGTFVYDLQEPDKEEAIYILLDSRSTPFNMLSSFLHEEMHVCQYFSKDKIFEADFQMSKKLDYYSSPTEILAISKEIDFSEWCLNNISIIKSSNHMFQLEKLISTRANEKHNKFIFSMHSIYNKYLIFSQIGKNDIMSKNILKIIIHRIYLFFNKSLNEEYKSIKSIFFSTTKRAKQQLEKIADINKQNDIYDVDNKHYVNKTYDKSDISHDLSIADKILSDEFNYQSSNDKQSHDYNITNEEFDR